MLLPAAHGEHRFGVQCALHAAVQHGASGLAGGGKVGACHAAPQGHHAGAKNFQRPVHGQADGLAAVGQQVTVLVDGAQADGGAAAACWVFTNAESVRLYRGNDFVAEFTPDRRGRFAALPHPPIEINDFVGSLLEKYEGMDHATGAQVAAILNELRRDAMALSPLSKARMLSLRLSWNELLRMYYKYIGVLGSSAPVYRFEAVWHGRAVRTVVREPVQSVRLECTVHNPLLTDGPTWDCAAVSLRAIDQNGNLLPYCGEAVCLSVDGPLKILGPSVVPLRGGMAGTYLATTGEAGRAVLHCRMEGALDTEAVLTVRSR